MATDKLRALQGVVRDFEEGVVTHGLFLSWVLRCVDAGNIEEAMQIIPEKKWGMFRATFSGRTGGLHRDDAAWVEWFERHPETVEELRGEIEYWKSVVARLADELDEMRGEQNQANRSG